MVVNRTVHEFRLHLSEFCTLKLICKDISPHVFCGTVSKVHFVLVDFVCNKMICLVLFEFASLPFISIIIELLLP